MAKIKAMGDIREKWTRVTPGRSTDYQKGIQGTAPGDWEGSAAAGADNWQQGVTMAAAEGRYATGVRGKGSRWQRKSLDVGAGRFGPGVQAAAPEFEAGFAPFHQALSGLTLPPRFPRGDPRNVDRVRVIAETLNAQRRR